MNLWRDQSRDVRNLSFILLVCAAVWFGSQAQSVLMNLLKPHWQATDDRSSKLSIGNH